MMLRVGLAVLTLFLTGGASAAEDPTNAAAFRAEQQRWISPTNPYGYQPVPQPVPTNLHPYDTDDGRRSRRPERQVDERFGHDDRFGNDVPRRQR